MSGSDTRPLGLDHQKVRPITEQEAATIRSLVAGEPDADLLLDALLGGVT